MTPKKPEIPLWRFFRMSKLSEGVNQNKGYPILQPEVEKAEKLLNMVSINTRRDIHLRVQRNSLI